MPNETSGSVTPDRPWTIPSNEQITQLLAERMKHNGVGVVIGVIELVSVVSDRLGVVSGPLAWVGSVDLADVGLWIVGLFVLTWLVSIAIWRWGRIEERWSTGLTGLNPD